MRLNEPKHAPFSEPASYDGAPRIGVEDWAPATAVARSRPAPGIADIWDPSADDVRRLKRTGSRLLTGGAVLLLVAVLALAGFRLLYGGKVYPAISVGGIQLGGMPRDEARTTLEAYAADLEDGTVTFTYGDRVFTPSLEDLGVTIQVADSLDAAYSIGRDEDAVGRLRVAHDLIQADRNLPLYASVDYGTMNAWFDWVDQELGLVPHDAYLVIDGITVTVEPEVDGTVVDRQITQDRVVDAVLGLSPINEPLPVVDWIASVRTADLAAAKARVEEALSQPVTVAFGDQEWELAPAELGRFIVQESDPGRSGAEAVTLRVDQDGLRTWLSEQYASAVYLEPVDAVVGWNQGPVSIKASVDGHQLKPEAFAEAVSASLLGDHAEVEIPVDVIKPQVDSANLGALGITTRLSRGTSNYAGSDYGRATNVQVGANLLNGTLVPPGGMFSFNEAIGAITPELGFVDAKVIEGERIGRDVGGGICQVSTTIFRAAILAGMPIMEWWPHAYRLEFYERDGWGPGYDASILQLGDPQWWSDFKFENPTDSWLLIESWSDGANVIVNLYGPETGWDVKVDDAVAGEILPSTPDKEVIDENFQPGCVVHTELPADGQRFSFYRRVTDASGDLLWEFTYNTTFQPRGNVWKVSPDMVGSSPAKGGSNWGNCTLDTALP